MWIATRMAPIAAASAVALAGCARTKPVAPAPKKVMLAVLAAESDRFPKAAKALTEELAKAHVAGVDATQVSHVSLEIVQLSIECVDDSVGCYEAVGRSLSANRLLFARIATEKRRQVKVTVTLFDVDAKTTKTTAEKLFPSEAAASAGAAVLVAEATR